MKSLEIIDNQKKLNVALKLLRMYANEKQGDVAAKIGVASSYLSEVENGNRNIPAKIINRYAEIFDVEAGFILMFAEKLRNDKQLEKKIFDKIKDAIKEA